MRHRIRIASAAPLAAAGLAALAYLNALDNPFVYDDQRVVVNNPTIRQPFDLPTIILGGATRPIVNLSYALDRAIWGPEPFGFHLTSVLLHVANTVLLYVLCRAFVRDGQRSQKGSEADIAPGIAAFVAATLFAVHPALSEAVGYVSGRSELLCALFFLSAFLSARQWFQQPGPKWWLLTFAFWAASLASKETAAMLPFVLFLYGRLVLKADRAEYRRRVLRLHLPIIALAVLAGAIRLLVLTRIEHPGSTTVQWSLLLVNLDIVRRYVWLILVPEGQTISHAVPMTTWLQARALWAIGVPASIAAAAWFLRRRLGTASVGLWWFLLLLLPSAVLVMLDRAEPMAEHRVYLACCGLFISAGILAAWLRARLETVSVRLMDLSTAIFCLILLSLATRTAVRNVVWGSEIELWAESRDQAPDHWLPHLMLAQAFDTVARQDAAVAEYREALRLRPDEEVIYRKLGVSLIGLQRYGEASALFEDLSTRMPQSATPSLGLAAIALAEGNAANARAFFLAAIDRDARNVEARQSLALLAETESADAAEALRWCREIHDLAPLTPGNDECIVRNTNRLSEAGK